MKKKVVITFFVILVIILIIILLIKANITKNNENMENNLNEDIYKNIRLTDDEIEQEKQYIKGMKIAESKNGKLEFLKEKIEENDYEQGYWKDYISYEYVIDKDMEDPNFDIYQYLGDSIYLLQIDNFYDYLGLKEKYNLKELEYEDFNYKTAYFIVNKESDTQLNLNGIYEGRDYITKENILRSYLIDNISYIDVSEEYKYGAMLLLIPTNTNYQNYIICYNNQVKISLDDALKICKEKMETIESINGKNDFIQESRILITNEYKNDFPDTENLYSPKENKNKQYTCWKFSAYSISDPLALCTIYINSETGEYVGGNISGD